MKLVAFRVREFRSVDDSDWIETDQATALIGTNESGKTNVLMPLWKLKGGPIDAIADYPRKRYHEIRAMKEKPVFIDAKFEMPADLIVKLAKLLRVPAEGLTHVIVSRDFGGNYRTEYPGAGTGPTVEKHALLSEFDSASADIEKATVADDAEQAFRKTTTDALQAARKVIADSANDAIDKTTLANANNSLAAVDTKTAPPTSVVAARFGQLVKAMLDHASIESDAQAAKDLVVKRVPSFVYYSNYGNLDSEIYLPHVIDNLKRKDLGQREQPRPEH